MKKGFTLVELLAVIIVLAAILAIVVPTVTDLVTSSKSKTKKASIELYGRALEQAALTYELEEKKSPKTLEDIKLYLEYTGDKVECENTFIGSGGDVRLEGCSVDGKLIEDYVYGSLSLGNSVLSHAKKNNYYYTDIPDFSKATKDGEFGLYSAEDDLGTSYYFRGDVENNYVKFGKRSNPVSGFMTDSAYYNGYGVIFNTLEECQGQAGTTIQLSCIYVSHGEDISWRIVRINGDGTIRLILSDIGSAYWKNHTTNYINSTAKKEVDDWYANTLADYSKYIADEIFCNDREFAYKKYYDSNYNEVAEESLAKYSDEYFAGYDRVINKKSPQLICNRNEDKYTVSKSSFGGNGELNYPIALLTADEMLMAGVSPVESGINNYLYDGTVFPTMTQFVFSQFRGSSFSSGAYESNRKLTEATLLNTSFVRPVINLKADVKFTGTGTKDDPYVIITE